MIPGSEKDHPGFFESFKYAIEGLRTAMSTERNINVQICAGALAVIAGFVLRLDLLSWALVVICIGLVVTAELVNTAIETVVDLASPEIHPLAKRAKDIAAASVLVFSICAAAVGLLVFANALMEVH